MTGAGGRSGIERAEHRHEPYEVVDLINGNDSVVPVTSRSA